MQVISSSSLLIAASRSRSSSSSHWRLIYIYTTPDTVCPKHTFTPPNTHIPSSASHIDAVHHRHHRHVRQSQQQQQREREVCAHCSSPSFLVLLNLSARTHTSKHYGATPGTCMCAWDTLHYSWAREFSDFYERLRYARTLRLCVAWCVLYALLRCARVSSICCNRSLVCVHYGLCEVHLLYALRAHGIIRNRQVASCGSSSFRWYNLFRFSGRLHFILSNYLIWGRSSQVLKYLYFSSS